MERCCQLVLSVFGADKVLNLQMANDDSKTLRNLGLDSLAESREEIRRALNIEEITLKHDSIWEAYSKTELGVGILKLSYRSSFDQPGKLRELKYTRKRMGAQKNILEQVDDKLKSADDLLVDSFLSLAKEEEFETGLEQARKARDLLKLALLESNPR